MTYISVEIDLGDIDTEELIDELKSRGYSIFEEDGPKNYDERLNLLYDCYRFKDAQKFDQTLHEIFWQDLGRMV